MTPAPLKKHKVDWEDQGKRRGFEYDSASSSSKYHMYNRREGEHGPEWDAFGCSVPTPWFVEPGGSVLTRTLKQRNTGSSRLDSRREYHLSHVVKELGVWKAV